MFLCVLLGSLFFGIDFLVVFAFGVIAGEPTFVCSDVIIPFFWSFFGELWGDSFLRFTFFASVNSPRGLGVGVLPFAWLADHCER